MRRDDRAKLSKFNELEEIPAIGTMIQVNDVGLTLEVVSVSYKYIDMHLYRVTIDVHLPKSHWRSIADFQKVYGVPH